MEDAVTAIIMAFSVLVFVIALSMMMYMVNILNITSTEVLFYSDRANFIENLRITNPNILSRDVGFDVVIPTLYRYYKENFCVKFIDGTKPVPETLHVFDLTLEGQVRSAASNQDPSRYQEGLNAIYNDNTLTSPHPTMYMFEAPWLGNINKDVKTRIDLYVSGKTGYINNVKVSYEDKSGTFNNIKQMKEWYDDEAHFPTPTGKKKVISETFIEYVFSGDTITAGEGEDIETITGDKQTISKIIITYTLMYEDK